MAISDARPVRFGTTFTRTPTRTGAVLDIKDVDQHGSTTHIELKLSNEDGEQLAALFGVGSGLVDVFIPEPLAAGHRRNDG